MSLAILYSHTLALRTPLVTVETHIANGLPNFNIISLSEIEVRESEDRVRTVRKIQQEFPEL